METTSRPPSVPSDDRGFLLGDALFETIGVHEGRPFRLERHLRRLREAARDVGIPVPPGLDRRVEEAIRSAAGRNAAMRITLSRGSGGGLAPPDPAEGRLVVSVRPSSGWTAPRGLRAAVHGRIDEEALTAGLKASGYLERIQALRLARAEGCDDALLRNTRGRIVEGSASNLFAVVGGALLAPGRHEGALSGVIREAVLESAGDAELTIEERGPTPEELGDASEIMLSSAIRGLVPVIGLSDSVVGDGRPGPVFVRLRSALEKLVATETRAPSGAGAGGQPSP